MTSINITPASYRDLAEILALQKLCYQKEADRYDDHTIPPLTQTLGEIQSEFSSTTFLKAIDGGRIIGSIKGRIDAGTCHVGRLMVHPDFRGKGLGKRLVQQLEQVMQGQDGHVTRFELFTGERSHDNIALYLGLGYEIYKKEAYDASKNIVYMEKRVARESRAT
ncbi:MAG: GNAT family N-acetyltransferase [Candidatus Lokiarchaeota archaeon]|nr:GNAT family N-acetyltransferase [Candidatus Lokiarchaeota archaeon]